MHQVNKKICLPSQTKLLYGIIKFNLEYGITALTKFSFTTLHSFKNFGTSSNKICAFIFCYYKYIHLLIPKAVQNRIFFPVSPTKKPQVVTVDNSSHSKSTVLDKWVKIKLTMNIPM